MGKRRRCENVALQLGFKFGKKVATILVATDVIGRGIDIKNVKTIINHDLPVKVTEYNNRIGRTARIGHEGKAISFYDPGTDSAIARRLCKVLGTAGQTIPMFLKEEGLFTPEMQFLESQDLGAYGPGDGSDYQPFNLDEDW